MGPAKLHAVNRTTARDMQTVAFQPVVFTWNGSAWVEYSSVAAKFGTATDASSPTTWYDGYGRTVDSTTTTTLPGRGYWRVAYKMWWYTGGTATGYDYVWGSHYVMSPVGGVTSVPYCST
jgi:hypothetical protein